MKLLLVITGDRIDLESQWRHLQIRKTAIDPMSLEKVPLHLKILRKTQNFDIPEAIFALKSEFLANFLSSLPVSLLETFFGLDNVWRSQLTKNSNKSESSVFWGKIFGVKSGPYDVIFRITSSGPEKKVQGVESFGFF